MITSLSLVLTAISATYAKNALPRLWLKTRIMTGLGCLGVKARVNGKKSAKDEQNLWSSPYATPRSTYPRLHGGKRPSFGDLEIKIGLIRNTRL